METNQVREIFKRELRKERIVLFAVFWTFLWFAEILLFFLQFEPAPPSFFPRISTNLFSNLHVIVKAIIAVYLTTEIENIIKLRKGNLKVQFSDGVCVLPEFRLRVFGFKCYLPLRGQIKTLTKLQDWGSYYMCFHWNSGEIRLLYHLLDDSEVIYRKFSEIGLFLQSIFQSASILIQEELLQHLNNGIHEKREKVLESRSYLRRRKQIDQEIDKLGQKPSGNTLKLRARAKKRD